MEGILIGLPNINIEFRAAGISAVQASQKGVVALILRDTVQETGSADNTSGIPKELTSENQAYIQRAFLGYVNPPRKVIWYVLGTDDSLTTALDWLVLQQFDYLAAPPDVSEEETQLIVSWIKAERINNHAVKAVLPHCDADSEAIVNFTTEQITCGNKVFTAAQYCSRIAGLIAGTPMSIACTYAPLPEVDNVEAKTKEELDEAIDSGCFVLFHDGEKVKVGSGVNSLQTATQEKGDSFKKIKIVEAMDVIRADVRRTAQDSYCGKYANSYDNKCLLIVAIGSYLQQLEQAGVLGKGTSTVEIDVESQKGYLKSIGTDITKMSDQKIKEANTGNKVFLKGSLSILDAIENISILFAV